MSFVLVLIAVLAVAGIIAKLAAKKPVVSSQITIENTTEESTPVVEPVKKTDAPIMKAPKKTKTPTTKKPKTQVTKKQNNG